jgi:hypothetical protein
MNEIELLKKLAAKIIAIETVIKKNRELYADYQNIYQKVLENLDLRIQEVLKESSL